jgi:hypothetical protein
MDKTLLKNLGSDLELFNFEIPKKNKNHPADIRIL